MTRKTGIVALVCGLAISGVVIADDAGKVKELREKAAKLWDKSVADHEKSVADLDAAVSLEEASQKDRAEARKLDWEAFQLSKFAKDHRKAWLEGVIRCRKIDIHFYEIQIRHDGAQLQHLEASLKDEEKSVADLRAAEKNEKNAATKTVIQGTAESAESEVAGLKQRVEHAKEQRSRDEHGLHWHQEQLKKYEAELKKLG
jgi:hypothetical protein